MAVTAFRTLPSSGVGSDFTFLTATVLVSHGIVLCDEVRIERCILYSTCRDYLRLPPVNPATLQRSISDLLSRDGPLGWSAQKPWIIEDARYRGNPTVCHVPSYSLSQDEAACRPEQIEMGIKISHPNKRRRA